MKFNHFGITHLGKVRGNNEDFYGSAQTINGYVFIVCDGMGGHAAGEIASAIATKSAIYYLNSKKYDNPIIAVYGAIQFANQKIIAEAANSPQHAGMGTTITLALIVEENLYIAHVGDSRIYLVSDNKLIRLTSDHSFVQNLVNQGVISEEEASHHPKKNQLSRALGINPNVEVTVSNEPIHLKKGDQILLCTDGLTGLVNDLTIHAILTNKKFTIEQKGEELINLANNAGGIDNITLIIIEVTESSNKKSNYSNYKISVNQVPKSSTNKLIKTAIIIALLLLVGFIGYSFLRQPTFSKKISNIINRKRTSITDSTTHPPDSVLYSPKSTDTIKKTIADTQTQIKKDSLNNKKHQANSNRKHTTKKRTNKKKNKPIRNKAKIIRYKIKPGDNLTKLSAKFKINLSILRNEAKKTKHCKEQECLLRVGDIINIPLQYSWSKKWNPSTKYRKKDSKATTDYFKKNKRLK